MRTIFSLVSVSVLALAGCGAANYAYRFDIADPGAHNVTRAGERDSIEDADVKVEIVVDPTSFQAILLDITNKTDQPMQVAWNGISIVGPDGTQTPLRPDSPEPVIEPGAKIVSRLVPFVLPARGPAAAAYDNSVFELVVPAVIRNTPRELRYHLRANVNAL